MVTQHISGKARPPDPLPSFLCLHSTLVTFPLGTRREMTQRPEEAGHRKAQGALEASMKMGSAHSSWQIASSSHSHTTEKMFFENESRLEKQSCSGYC